MAAGTAEHLGVGVPLVRGALLALGCVGGIGVVAYLLLWCLVAQEPEAPVRPEPAGTGPAGAGRAGAAPVWSPAGGAGGQVLVGAALVAIGAVAALHRFGVGAVPTALVPGVVAVTGLVLAGTQLDAAERERWLVRAGGGSRDSGLRVVAGVLLAAVGLVLLVVRGAGTAALGPAVVSVLAVLAGVALLGGPWRCACSASCVRSGRAACVRPGGPRSPLTCTTRCCRRWR